MPRKQAALKRRTTLTLPSDSNLSTVISEVVSQGLQIENARHRRNRILENHRGAFTGFSEDELAILDGVILEPVGAGRR
jgi:hypothetical protein